MFGIGVLLCFDPTFHTLILTLLANVTHPLYAKIQPHHTSNVPGGGHHVMKVESPRVDKGFAKYASTCNTRLSQFRVATSRSSHNARFFDVMSIDWRKNSSSVTPWTLSSKFALLGNIAEKIRNCFPIAVFLTIRFAVTKRLHIFLFGYTKHGLYITTYNIVCP